MEGEGRAGGGCGEGWWRVRGGLGGDEDKGRVGGR